MQGREYDQREYQEYAQLFREAWLEGHPEVQVALAEAGGDAMAEARVLEAEYWCAQRAAPFCALPCCAVLWGRATVRRHWGSISGLTASCTCDRRLVERVSEDEVIVDYANDIDTEMCVPAPVARQPATQSSL